MIEDVCGRVCAHVCVRVCRLQIIYKATDVSLYRNIRTISQTVASSSPFVAEACDVPHFCCCSSSDLGEAVERQVILTQALVCARVLSALALGLQLAGTHVLSFSLSLSFSFFAS